MAIANRLILTLATALLALILVGSVGLWRLKQAQERFDYVQVNILPSSNELIVGGIETMHMVSRRQMKCPAGIRLSAAQQFY